MFYKLTVKYPIRGSALAEGPRGAPNNLNIVLC